MGAGGRGGVKNFSVGICDGAPLTARSSCLLLLVIVNNLFQITTAKPILTKLYRNVPLVT